jgi:hypothetical protein
VTSGESRRNVVDEYTEPGATKGKVDRPRRTAVKCTHAFEEGFEDPDLGELTPGLMPSPEVFTGRDHFTWRSRIW